MSEEGRVCGRDEVALGRLEAVVASITSFLATVVCPPFVREELRRRGGAVFIHRLSGHMVGGR